MTLRFGSVCSGIEAASVAWNPLGWEAAWFSEIEPFPCAVLAHRFPTVPNYGDITTLPERILSGEVEAPDILCGGTPCQAFSNAGKRLSLADERGNLSLVFCRIADAIDTVRASAGKPPCIIFWENVPGVLRTPDNAFGAFLAGLAGESVPFKVDDDKFGGAGLVLGAVRSIAWRVLDAQHFGVPQRRRRVFVVGSSRNGFDPGAVLFERKGVSGNPEKGERQEQDPAAGTGDRTPGDRMANGSPVTDTLTAHDLEQQITSQTGGGVQDEDTPAQQSKGHVIYDMTHGDDVIRTYQDTSPTMKARMGTGGNQVPIMLSSSHSTHMAVEDQGADSP